MYSLKVVFFFFGFFKGAGVYFSISLRFHSGRKLDLKTNKLIIKTHEKPLASDLTAVSTLHNMVYLRKCGKAGKREAGRWRDSCQGL